MIERLKYWANSRITTHTSLHNAAVRLFAGYRGLSPSEQEQIAIGWQLSPDGQAAALPSTPVQQRATRQPRVTTPRASQSTLEHLQSFGEPVGFNGRGLAPSDPSRQRRTPSDLPSIDSSPIVSHSLVMKQMRNVGSSISRTLPLRYYRDLENREYRLIREGDEEDDAVTRLSIDSQTDLYLLNHGYTSSSVNFIYKQFQETRGLPGNRACRAFETRLAYYEVPIAEGRYIWASIKHGKRPDRYFPSNEELEAEEP